MNIERIPPRWQICKLRDVATIITGNTPPKDESDNYGDQYPWVKPPDLESKTPIIQTKEYLSDKGAQKARLLPPKTVLVSCIGILGKVGLAGTTLATNQQINAVIFKNIVIPEYGFYFCKTLKEWLENNSSSTTVSIINKERFSEAPFIFPPLNEQRRIVAKLEVLLGKVDGCQKRLEKIPRILKRFRQSVLAAACDGRLTADWRERNKDVEPAIKILESVEKQNIKTKIDESLFVNDLETPDNWEIVNIRNICTNSFYGPRFGRDEYVENGVPTIRTTDMTENGNIVLKDPPKVQVPNNRLKDFQVVKNDLLVTRTGSIGVMAVFKGDYVAIPSAYLIRFRFLPQIITDYVFYFLKSVRGQNLLGLSSTAVTQPNINAEVIKDLLIPLPPLAEQQEIVRRVESLFKLADQLEARYQKAKSYVDKLTQSILAKAFRGELVAQDPNDEPARVLLERIKQEKEAATTEKSRKVNVKSKVANKKEPKEIIVENKAQIDNKFVEIVGEKKSSSLDKMVADIEKLGEQMTLPFIAED